MLRLPNHAYEQTDQCFPADFFDFTASYTYIQSDFHIGVLYKQLLIFTNEILLKIGLRYNFLMGEYGVGRGVVWTFNGPCDRNILDIYIIFGVGLYYFYIDMNCMSFNKPHDKDILDILNRLIW